MKTDTNNQKKIVAIDGIGEKTINKVLKFEVEKSNKRRIPKLRK